jgi:ATPase subunit of ABC transporter with duplicated ATPase domains
MAKVVYHIVEHDGGWAYKVEGTYSETFRSHDEAKAAAQRAAREQQVGGEEAGITWEDAQGVWHEEVSAGGDRPATEVEG